MAQSKEVFIVGMARTPVGSFQGALSAIPAPKLGATAIQGALQRAGVQPSQVSEVIMGNVLTAGEGQAPARQAMIAAGIAVAIVTTVMAVGTQVNALFESVRSGFPS